MLDPSDLSVTVGGALTATSFGGITSANLLDKTATETISGAYTFSTEVTAPSLRLTDTDDVSLASTLHAFQIGPSAGLNLRIDSNEISCVQNGVANTLHLQADGGTIECGANTAVNFSVVNNSNIYLRDGGNLRIHDTGDTDYADFTHDGTDFLTTFVNTSNWNLSGALALQLTGGMDIDLRDAGILRIRDSGDTDYAEFSHNGTDFNTALTNTTSWNLTGFNTLRPSADVSLSSGYDLYTHGGFVRIRGSTSANYCQMSHDSTDFNIAFTNTTECNWSGGTILNMADQDIKRARLMDYAVKTSTPGEGAANTFDLDLEVANSFLLDMADPDIDGNITVTVSNPPPNGYYGEFVLKFTQHSTARTVTWPGTFKWPGGVAPTMSTGNDEVDIIHGMTTDSGTTWYCTFMNNFA
jgi:hypothetical protein